MKKRIVDIVAMVLKTKGEEIKETIENNGDKETVLEIDKTMVLFNLPNDKYKKIKELLQ